MLEVAGRGGMERALHRELGREGAGFVSRHSQSEAGVLLSG